MSASILPTFTSLLTGFTWVNFHSAQMTSSGRNLGSSDVLELAIQSSSNHCCHLSISGPFSYACVQKLKVTASVWGGRYSGKWWSLDKCIYTIFHLSFLFTLLFYSQLPQLSLSSHYLLYPYYASCPFVSSPSPINCLLMISLSLVFLLCHLSPRHPSVHSAKWFCNLSVIYSFFLSALLSVILPFLFYNLPTIPTPRVVPHCHWS